MKKLVSIAVVVFAAATLFLAGCSHKNDTVNGLIRSFTQNGNTTTFTYDSQGRLSSGVSTDGSHGNAVYSGNQVTIYSYDSAATAPTDSATFTLNSDGLVASESDGTTHTYNSDHQETGSANVGNSFTSTTVYTNGNATTKTNTSSGTVSTYTYTYMTDKTEYRVGPYTFYGKPSKNVLSVETYTQGSTVHTDTHTYEFDSKGRVTKDTDVGNGPGGTTTDVVTFNYF